MRSTAQLDAQLEEAGVDAYLFDTDGGQSDQYYLSQFTAPDPFIACYRPEGMALFVSGLEYGRANKEAAVDEVVRHSTYNYRDLIAEYGQPEGRSKAIANFLADRDVESVLVPERFPLVTADGLREEGIDVTVDSTGVIEQLRAIKTETELDAIETTQRANEAAMARAETLLAQATISDEGTLMLDGEPLTSERVTQAIEHELLDADCALEETIVAGGADAADPHNRGSGPLAAGDAIVIDIFPRSKETRYYADMTRTFVRGEPSEELQRRYELTRQAQAAALEAIEPGVTGAAVHDAVCDVYEDAGYETLRSNPDTETGFIHGTGHGVGLDIHESPQLNPDGETLEAGQVVTVEPGLYDPAIGGIRIEDLVVITDTEQGYRNLTDYEKTFVVAPR